MDQVGVFNVLGRRVRELPVTAGRPGAGRVLWDGSDGDGRPVAPGVYFVRLRTGTETRTVRTVRVR